MDSELLAKAKAAKSPEELLKIAHENGMSDFTEENAKAYFAEMHKSGEMSDDELENAAGGCKRGGRTVVTILNSCKHWHCDRCNQGLGRRDSLSPRSSYLPESALYECHGYMEHMNSDEPVYHKHQCNRCYYCSYEGGMWYCNNSAHNAE